MPDGSHADSLAGAVHCLGDVVPKGDRPAVPVGLRTSRRRAFDRPLGPSVSRVPTAAFVIVCGGVDVVGCRSGVGRQDVGFETSEDHRPPALHERRPIGAVDHLVYHDPAAVAVGMDPQIAGQRAPGQRDAAIVEIPATSSRMPWRDQPANGLDASQAEGSAVQQDRLALNRRRSPQRPPTCPCPARELSRPAVQR